MLPKIQKYIEACTLCQRTKPKNTKQRPYYSRIPIEYIPCESLAVDLKKMPMGILYHEFLLIATCEKTNFVHAIPMQNRQTETIANALLHWVCCLTGPPMKIVHRPGLSTNISSNKRIADKPGMYNANNKPMESRQLKRRKTDSNNWKYDKQTFDAERSVMAFICSSQCICYEYFHVYRTTRLIPVRISFRKKTSTINQFRITKINIISS